MPHAVHATRHFPSVELLRQVAHVVGHGMQFEIQFILVFVLLELLTTVLLVTHDSLQPTLAQVQRVVPHGFVVVYLLEGQCLAVAMIREALATLQLACLLVALALNNAGCLVEDGSRQVRVAPLLVYAQHQASCPLAEL